MPTKRIRDTKAAESLSAYVIMKGTRHVATVQSYSGHSRVMVNVMQWGEAAEKTARTAREAGGPFRLGQYDTTEADAARFQHGEASGYGYDKFTAALRGLIIDGHVMTDHCSRLDAPNPPRGRKTFPSDYRVKRGFYLANYADGGATWPDGGKRYPNVPEGESGFTDCYRKSGLEYLEAHGYKVIKAI